MSPLHYRFEQTLAWHCAPSLAGIKAADLLTWTVEGREGADLLSHYAELLSSRGIRLYVLGARRGRTLLLIFRPRQLDCWLAQAKVREMLDRAGYPVSRDTEAMLAHLRRRLQGGEFPHEIGLFLGYPPGDVEGFLRDGGRHCKLCGPWKVYDNVEEAARRFAAFHRCRDALTQRVDRGVPRRVLILYSAVTAHWALTNIYHVNFYRRRFFL